MNYLKKALILVAPCLLAACIGNQVSQEEYEACIWTTSIAGAAVGTAVASTLPGAVIGTVVGAGSGVIVCSNTIGAAREVVRRVEPDVSQPDLSSFPYTVWDSDEDGVIDERDVCWQTPQGTQVEENGCGIDTDGDGVPDHRDQCPGTPLGSVVFTDGCPRILASIENIHFETDSSGLDSMGKTILKKAVPWIKTSSVPVIRVEGHADSRASDEYNIALSKRRTQAVIKYLQSQGIPSSRLKAVAKGESAPIAPNDTESGRARNRRVELIAE